MDYPVWQLFPTPMNAGGFMFGGPYRVSVLRGFIFPVD